MKRPIDPRTGQPHNYFRVEGCGMPRGALPRELTAIFAQGCPYKTEQGTSHPLGFPLVVATGLANEEKDCLEKIVKILNEHWYDEE